MINFLDPDATHDILFAQKIKGQILSILKTAIGDMGLFDDLFPIVFVDRITPGGLTPWAENWSGMMFEFLKKLSRTHILDDGYLNGSAYGFEPPYQADLPSEIDLSTHKTDTITVSVPAGTQNGILTWIERSHDPISAPYCAKLLTPIATTTRRSRVFKNAGDTPQTFTISTKNWLHNSVCVSGIDLVGLTDNQATFLLYSQMQGFLDYLWGELGIPDECKVLKAMTARLTTVFVVDQRQWAWNAASISPTTVAHNLTLENAVFNPVPESYHYAFLQVGEEKFGKSLTPIYADDRLYFELAYNFEFFENWEAVSGRQNPAGFSRDPGGQLSPEWSCSVPYNPTYIDFQITAFNLPIYFSTVQQDKALAPYPPFSFPQNAAAINHNNVESVSPDVFRFFPFFDFYEDGEIATNYYIYGFPINTPTYSVGTGFVSGLYIQENIPEGMGLYISPDFLGITFFCGDPNLFKNSTSAIFWHDIAKKNISLLEETDEGYIQIGRTREEKTTKLAIRIDATYHDYLLQEPEFLTSVINSSSTGLFSDTTIWGGGGIDYVELPPNPTEIEVVSTVNLSKSFA